MTRLDLYAKRVDNRKEAGTGNGSSARAASIKGAGTKDTSAGSTSTRGAGIRDGGIGDIGIEDAEIRDDGIGDAEIRDVGLEDAYAAGVRGIGNVDVLKDLGIHLQSSQILEVRLFNTGLETWIGAVCIQSACIDRTLEVRSAKLEV